MESSRAAGSILLALNATFLTLIPKTDTAATPAKFRPISLCNVIYKIISKVIVNRLKPLMPSLISQEQTSFVEGRQILDGIIIAHEVIHTLRTSSSPGMVIKLDIAKAFDKASWQFLRGTLVAFGFS